MDWQAPLWLPLGPVLVLLLVWVDQKSVHAMPVRRRKLLLLVRSLAVLAVVAALAGPVVETHSSRQAVGLVMDLSQSMGQDGLERVLNAERDLREGLPSTSEVFTVALGAQPTLWRPEDDAMNLARAWQIEHGADSDYAEALRFASALFPPGSGKNVVVLGDGTPTRGEMDRVARDLAADGILVHALAVAGEPRPDVRVAAFSAARTQVREGASVDLQAELRSTGAEVVRLRLFEDGLEVESRVLELPAGASQTVHFERTPSGRGLRAFRLVAEPTGADELPQNNEGLALVDVQGRLRWLAVTLDSDSVAGLQRAMAAEEVQVETVTPERAPRTMDQLAAYDGVILAAVPAHRLGEEWMKLLRDYVDRLGGGLLMLGDSQTFGVGGYFQTPVEEMLPVRLRAPDEEEKQSAAVALVIDRSGSMAGEKLETAKSAAMATAEVLDRMDYLGVFAFDSEGKVVVPMTRLTSKAAVAGQIATLSAGGGTNLEPALQMAREALGRVKARVKHIIVLTDGQTAGSGYENLASLCRAEGMTISTVAIGEGSHVALLQAMASAGGGQAYSTLDAAGITRIFTQDTLMHTSNLIREEPFEAQVAEPHPMISGLEKWNAPPLLGYVKTLRRAAAQVPLVTAAGDPLLAQWRFGLGKVSAFTSDASERWAALWTGSWRDFGVFWAQVLRDTARVGQSRRMDIECAPADDAVRVQVDLRDDGGSWARGAEVRAEWFFVPPDAMGGTLTALQSVTLEQQAPGRFEKLLPVDKPGVYLLRAQALGETGSAGYVYQPSGEAAGGEAQEESLRRLTEITGGVMLDGSDDEVPLNAPVGAAGFREVWPPLALTAFVLFLVDVVIRRWDHVRSLLRRSSPAG